MVNESEIQEKVDQSINIQNSPRGRVFAPRVDIYETEKTIELVADIPGADGNSVEITLEKNVLNIYARNLEISPENYRLSYSESGRGDYQRSFALSDRIDQDNIQAEVKQGVLYLSLPKAGPSIAKKIQVKTV